MKHKLFTLGSAVSLMLCAATVVLWVRSYWHPVSATLWVGAGGNRVKSFRQSNAPWVYAADVPTGALNFTMSEDAVFNQLLLTRRIRGFAGITFVTERMGSHVVWRSVGVPLIYAEVLFAMLPLMWCVRKLRQANQPLRCVKCGYDLRATPDRCPECGMPVPQKAGA